MRGISARREKKKNGREEKRPERKQGTGNEKRGDEARQKIFDKKSDFAYDCNVFNNY